MMPQRNVWGKREAKPSNKTFPSSQKRMQYPRKHSDRKHQMKTNSQSEQNMLNQRLESLEFQLSLLLCMGDNYTFPRSTPVKEPQISSNPSLNVNLLGLSVCHKDAWTLSSNLLVMAHHSRPLLWSQFVYTQNSFLQGWCPYHV